MSKRRTITERMKIRSFLYHCSIICVLCGERILHWHRIEWDHQNPIALGGSDEFPNIRCVHRICHRRKTIGVPASTAGSDIQKIAKSKRIPKKMLVNKRPPGTKPPTKKRRWGSRWRPTVNRKGVNHG